MSNCTELVAHSTSQALWQCIDRCDLPIGQLNETSHCLCQCLSLFMRNNDYHYLITWLYCVLAFFLILIPCNEYWRRRRLRRAQLDPEPSHGSAHTRLMICNRPIQQETLKAYYNLPTYQQAVLPPPSYHQ